MRSASQTMTSPTAASPGGSGVTDRVAAAIAAVENGHAGGETNGAVHEESHGGGEEFIEDEDGLIVYNDNEAMADGQTYE